MKKISHPDYEKFLNLDFASEADKKMKDYIPINYTFFGRISFFFFS